ncbi:MAG: tetratricopeptide repeat protein [Ignavibacteriota bacterium]
MFWQAGDFEQAIRSLNEAERLLRGRDEVGHARVLNNLGLYYQSLSENEKALAYFQSALAFFLGQHQRTVRVRLNIGRSYMLIGRLDRAQSALEQALAEAVKLSDSTAKADVLNNLGQVLLRLHRADQARSRLTESLGAQRSFVPKEGKPSPCITLESRPVSEATRKLRANSLSRLRGFAANPACEMTLPNLCLHLPNWSITPATSSLHTT